MYRFEIVLRDKGQEQRLIEAVTKRLPRVVVLQGSALYFEYTGHESEIKRMLEDVYFEDNIYYSYYNIYNK